MRKNRLGILVVVIVVFLLAFMFRDQFIHKSLGQEVSHLLKDETVIEGVSIIKFTAGGKSKITKYPIDDDQTISTMLGGFIDLKLKKINTSEVYLNNMDFGIEVIATNQTKHTVTQTLHLTFNDRYLILSDFKKPFRQYEIVNDSNYLEIMQSIIENEDLEWIDL